MDPITILAAIAPLGVELGKSLISRFLGQADFKPANIDDWLKMRGVDLDMFKAMNDAGGANPSYPWVEAIVRLQRPMVAAVALGVWSYTQVAGMPSDTVNNFAAAIGFYLFGDRTLFYVRKAGGK
ncbi:MAG TPA: hypothetical protein VJ698_15715 [Noviherbaspirillum sp.]|uniref:hypothetical protein n=1 Tax=Noviherbaspirillum sp. TaxID=1926288 RepID=UPI002B466367|nr:hypothetical protein [Noviherbaspirillum sp.]HJV86913.1 hypothetical protein [Noviherbaspirillum sp.]